MTRTGAPSGLDRLRSRVVRGTELTVVEHTWRPNLVGTVYRARGPVTGSLRLMGPNRIPTFVRVPTDGRKVEWLDDDTVTWYLPNDPMQRLTLRVGPPRRVRR